MPVDYQQIYLKIQQIGAGAQVRRQALADRRAHARLLLEQYASRLDDLRHILGSAKEADSNIRCAAPTDEKLNASYPVEGAASNLTVIAADGSQINPDRHAAVQFGLVNVGAIVMNLNSGESPLIITESELFHGEDLLPNGIPMSDGLVALQRDLKERAKLEELSKGFSGPVVTITDGPIELWGAKGDDAQSYAEFVQKYLTILSRMQSRGVTTAGYVDKPAADLVVRLLEIAAAGEANRSKLREFHPLWGVSDRWLFGQRQEPLLPAGHRSAVFGLQSGSEKKYTGLLSLHFFYLNVGTDKHPWPVRVEIPKWVADDKEKLNLLHRVLLDQCSMMGSRPYPYLLHRAHETAVVGQDEKYQIEHMLAQELWLQGDEMDDMSHKGSAKSLAGRSRR